MSTFVRFGSFLLTKKVVNVIETCSQDAILEKTPLPNTQHFVVIGQPSPLVYHTKIPKQ